MTLYKVKNVSKTVRKFFDRRQGIWIFVEPGKSVTTNILPDPPSPYLKVSVLDNKEKEKRVKSLKSAKKSTINKEEV